MQAQINALREYEATKPGRGIPDKASDRLLLATWNIANLGRPAQVSWNARTAWGF